MFRRRPGKTQEATPLLGAVLFFLGLFTFFTSPVSVLWFFAAVYLFFWSSFIWAVRYAIAAVLVLGLLVGDRLEAASLAPGRALPLCALLAFVYCGVFSTLVAVILEMYPHEPPFLVRAIDHKAFLRGELPPFGATDFLNGRAGPSDLRVYQLQ